MQVCASTLAGQEHIFYVPIYWWKLKILSQIQVLKDPSPAVLYAQ